ncbi:MAG: hypothetical protein AAF641_09240 [Pseudomonadota bacterium]
MTKFKTFWKDGNGAISVDWIVLSACLVGLAALAGNAALDGIEALGGQVSSDMSDTDV